MNPLRGWEFPGGKVENCEDPWEAARRECREEAGIMVENLKILGIEDGIMFLVGNVLSFLDGHEFKRAFFKSLPPDLGFPREEYEKYIDLALKSINCGNGDVIESKL